MFIVKITLEKMCDSMPFINTFTLFYNIHFLRIPWMLSEINKFMFMHKKYNFITVLKN